MACTNLICCHFTTLVGERLNIHTPHKKLSANAKIALQEKKEEAENVDYFGDKYRVYEDVG